MSGATVTAGRLGLMLTELRLPTIKRLAADLCTQSDREGWPAHRLLDVREPEGTVDGVVDPAAKKWCRGARKREHSLPGARTAAPAPASQRRG